MGLRAGVMIHWNQTLDGRYLLKKKKKEKEKKNSLSPTMHNF